MAKKVIKVEDKKETKKNLDLGSLAAVVMENKDAVGKIVDGIGDILNSGDTKTKKSSSKKTTTKKKTKKESKSDLENIIDIAGKILK